MMWFSIIKSHEADLMIYRMEWGEKCKKENWGDVFSLVFFIVFDFCEWIFPSEKWGDPAFSEDTG